MEELTMRSVKVKLLEVFGARLDIEVCIDYFVTTKCCTHTV